LTEPIFVEGNQLGSKEVTFEPSNIDISQKKSLSIISKSNGSLTLMI